MLVFDKTLAQPDFAVLYCSAPYVVMTTLLPCFNAQPNIFAVMKRRIVALGVDSSDIQLGALIVYIQCNDT